MILWKRFINNSKRVVQRFLRATEDLLDRKLKNGTVMVVIISSCIVSLGVVHGGNGLTANILESGKKHATEQHIFIGGKKYKIILEEVK